MLPLDSPRSPRPNAAVDAVALIVARVIQQNETYLRSIYPKTPEYRYPRLVAQFTYADGQLSKQLEEAGFGSSEAGELPGLPDAAMPIVQKRIHKFVYNFAYRTRMRNETLVGALVYLDRIVEKAGFVVFRANWLLLMTQCLIAVQKMYDDFHYSLKDYVKVVNVPLNVLNRIEHTFLKLIRYDLVVRQADYMRYRNYITAKYTGCELRPAYPSSPMSTLLGLASIRDYCESIRQTRRQPDSVQFTSNTTVNASGDSSISVSRTAEEQTKRSQPAPAPEPHDPHDVEGSQAGTDGVAENSDVEEDEQPITASQADLHKTLMHMDEESRGDSAPLDRGGHSGRGQHAAHATHVQNAQRPSHSGRPDHGRPESGPQRPTAKPNGNTSGPAGASGRKVSSASHASGESSRTRENLSHVKHAENVSGSVGDLLKQVKLPTNKF